LLLLEPPVRSAFSGEPVSSFLIVAGLSFGTSLVVRFSLFANDEQRTTLLPGRFRNSGDLAPQRQLPETQTANAELP
jgi:predicted permease